MLLLAIACLGGKNGVTGDWPEIGPLPPMDPPDAELADLGRHLFFDPRLSGDGSMSCATCHGPNQAFTDGQALAGGYPGTKGFRNTPTLINMRYLEYFYWDARLDGQDAQTQVRDQLTESHVLAMDGRLMLERWKQVPEYTEAFESTMGGEPSFGRTLKAVSAFEQTLVSRETPFDQGTLDADQEKGRRLFEGKAGCVRCHNGALLTDSQVHALGVPENPEIVQDPLRHLTMRAWAKSLGVDNFEALREDPGYYSVSKQDEDWGKFRTPPLRELVHTAPYMHNGMLETLEEVVEFYDAGGGVHPNKDPSLRPLGLSDAEKAQLVAFLEGLSGEPLEVETPQYLPYQVIENWYQVEN